MVRTFGVVFIGIIVSVIPFTVGILFNRDLLMAFSQNQSLGIMATILALNVTSVTFMLGTLISIEIKAKKTIFKSTRRQLHHNIILMTVLFLLNLTAVLGAKSGQNFSVNSTNIDITAILGFFSIFLLVLMVIAMYEIVHAVFQIKDFLEDDQS